MVGRAYRGQRASSDVESEVDYILDVFDIFDDKDKRRATRSSFSLSWSRGPNRSERAESIGVSSTCQRRRNASPMRACATYKRPRRREARKRPCDHGRQPRWRRAPVGVHRRARGHEATSRAKVETNGIIIWHVRHRGDHAKRVRDILEVLSSKEHQSRSARPEVSSEGAYVGADAVVRSLGGAAVSGSRPTLRRDRRAPPKPTTTDDWDLVSEEQRHRMQRLEHLVAHVASAERKSVRGCTLVEVARNHTRETGVAASLEATKGQVARLAYPAAPPAAAPPGTFIA